MKIHPKAIEMARKTRPAQEAIRIPLIPTFPHDKDPRKRMKKKRRGPLIIDLA